MRRAACLTLALFAAGCGGHHRPPPHRRRRTAPVLRAHARLGRTRPNVVFVLTDDLSTDLLRYLPAVRALRRRGVSFSRYVVSDSLCCPSRASILTGRLPHDTGVFTNIRPDGGLYAFTHHHDGRRTFASVLRRRGYRTALLGKYLNGYPASSGVVPRGWTDWAATDKGYLGFDYTLDEDGRPTHYGSAPGDYLTDVIAARGERLIGDAAAKGQPFFLELASFAPHRPAVPAPRDATAFPRLQAPRDAGFDRPQHDGPGWLGARPPLARPVLRRIDRDYRHRARSVLAVDDLLVGVERALRRTGETGDTYVVFSSDNGYHMGQHRLLPGKLTAFDTDVRVPLVIAGPGVPRHRHVGALASNTDLAPTFAAIAGTAMPGADGRSLLPLLHGRTPRDWRRAALVEHHHPRRTHKDPDQQTGESGDPPGYEALRTLHRTYVEYDGGADRPELYDDRRDPAQLRNRYTALSPRARRRWHRRLLRMEHCHGATCAISRPAG